MAHSDDQLIELKSINTSLGLLLAEARRIPDVSQGVTEIAEIVSDIHTLVNSEKTAGIQRELASTQRELLLLEELGRPASVIQAARDRIQELQETLSERDSAQAKVDKVHR
jgi:hypothetical protein